MGYLGLVSNKLGGGSGHGKTGYASMSCLWSVMVSGKLIILFFLLVCLKSTIQDFVKSQIN